MNQDATQQQLKSAYALIKARKNRQALDILRPIVSAQRDNVQAWWLIANALEGPDQRCKALERVLKLRPGHPQATQLLEKMQSQAPPPPDENLVIDAEDENLFDDVEDDGSDPFADELDAIAEDASLERQPRVLKFEQTPNHINKKGKRTADNDAYIYMMRMAALMVAVIMIGGGAFVAFDRFMATTQDELTEALMGDFAKDFAFDGSWFEVTSGVLEPGQTINGEIIDPWILDFWEFDGLSGELVTIHVQQVDATYGPLFFLLDPNEEIIAYGDTSVGYVDWTQIQSEIILPLNGTYVIAIGSDAGVGRYALTIYK